MPPDSSDREYGCQLLTKLTDVRCGTLLTTTTLTKSAKGTAFYFLDAVFHFEEFFLEGG